MTSKGRFYLVTVYGSRFTFFCDEEVAAEELFRVEPCVLALESGLGGERRDFRHVALYDEREGRVEMHLESTREQTVRVEALGLDIDFRAGERVHTENSYKYSLDELSALAADTGFGREHTWLDPAGRFSSNLFVAKEVISDE